MCGGVSKSTSHPQTMMRSLQMLTSHSGCTHSSTVQRHQVVCRYALLALLYSLYIERSVGRNHDTTRTEYQYSSTEYGLQIRISSRSVNVAELQPDRICRSICGLRKSVVYSCKYQSPWAAGAALCSASLVQST